MADQTKILRLVIASPEDVQAERDVVVSVVEELNGSIGTDRGLRLEVIRWETDAFPAFHPSGPQGLIDSVLHIEDADIIVGIFWKRFGTPVKGAKSGTEHELKLAYEAWKKNGRPQIMVYFSERPYTPKSKQETDQWGNVLEFKQQFPKEGMWWPYGERSEFERLLRSHLVRVISGLVPLENRLLYLEHYARLIHLANSEIILIANKFHRTTDRPEAKPINDALRAARTRGVSARILMADGYDRLPGAIELHNDSDVDVRFDPAVHLADVSYVCVDKTHVILAARSPSHTRPSYLPSTSSVELSAASLAEALSKEFDRRWSALTTRTLGQHLREVVPGMIMVSSAETVARELGLPVTSIAAYQRRRPFVVFLIGRPGAGKTAIAEQLVKAAYAAGVFVSASHLSDLGYLRSVFAMGQGLGTRYKRLDEGGFLILDSDLYREALTDLAQQVSRHAPSTDLLILEFARTSYLDALDILSKKEIQPDLVIYLDVTMETALERNRQRARRLHGDNHFVSEREMRETYANDDIAAVLEVLRKKTVVIQNETQSEPSQKEKAVEIMQEVKARL